MSIVGGSFEVPGPRDTRQGELGVAPAADIDQQAEDEAVLERNRVAEAREEAELTAAVMGNHYLALEPDERVTVTDWLEPPQGSRQAIFVGRGELVIHDRVHGHRDRHFALPGAPAGGQLGLPVARRVVAVVIHHKPVGRKSLGNRFVLVLDDGDQPLATLDNSMDYGANSAGVWELNLDGLGMMCRAVRLPFNIESHDGPRDFIDARPAWVPAHIEFETDHKTAEETREWGLAIGIGFAAALLLSTAGVSLIFVGPVGPAVTAVAVLAIGVGVGLTLFSHSKWRARRALRQRASIPAATDPRTGLVRYPAGGAPGTRQ
jgi:hypothetical protein